MGEDLFADQCSIPSCFADPRLKEECHYTPVNHGLVFIFG